MSEDLMNAYVTGDYQKHCIVAQNMQEAVKLYVEKYGEEPEEIELFSEYVLVQK